ncbi:23S rRNA pseudouridine1911/1915/1917 synthase [Dyella sp. SG562]|uniref:23S rRNA pseudouridine(1911/1915/1917) synthase RluD n=1 Tax=Dyella TaxID=231454 RepID=UPI001420D3D2|nr:MULTISPECIES: 23S rRNA pseudouridine(1911/1915/1917) synthase RluD [unclassified Dyella]NII71804.1 23S rRNA pseudouridine1911/1915/1917 synthase [Dyella sp. SG562]NKJ21438.1 23S rRNA pseudouridine1911/1915/1917 synthase [Dyella sp. SG609]
MTTIRHEATVPLSAAGWRFDRALAEMFPDYSRSRLAAWIKAGAVTLDGAAAPPRHLLRGGEQVRLEAELAAEVELEPEDIALEVVHQDEHLLVLNKPAGLVVHPGAGNAAGTLLNALLHHDPKLAELPRGGIVHRLDKDTSGLMVVARSLAAHTALVDMLSRHEVERQYEAVVMGLLVAGGTVDAPIGRHMGDRLRQAVRDEEDGKRAVTHYRLRERFRAHALLQCSLETGRTHQIRVHMAHIGHPLVGDPLYGGGLRLPKGASPELVAALRGFRRQALHAERLAFEHPVSGEPLSFTAARPADLDALINTLREDAAHADPYDDY